MKPALAQFESEQKNVPFTHVDVDDMEGKDFQKFGKFLPKENASIPYTVLLTASGEEVGNWTGPLSYAKLVEEVGRTIKDHRS